MYKLLILFLTFLLRTCLISCVVEKFEIFRSADLQLNKTSHEHSDLFAFHLDELKMKNYLKEIESAGNEEDKVETHPIDFTKINLNKFVEMRNGLVKKDEIQNNKENSNLTARQDEDGKTKSRRYPLKMRKNSKQQNLSSKNESNKNELNKSEIFNYEYYCSPNHYLAECLSKRLSSRFLIRFKSKNYRSNIGQVIEDLTKLNSSLESSIKSTVPRTKSIKNVILALDKTFYNTEFLGQLLSDCILSYQKNCEKSV